MSTELETLFEVAKYQKGFLATYQVETSDQLLRHYEQSGRIERVLRGIYRMNQYLHEEDEQLMIAYLWSKEQGVISHESALGIHDLSDALPKKVHLTLPENQRRIRRQKPDWLELHFGDVSEDAKQWHDVVPVTKPGRTLVDIAIDGLEPELLRQAVEEAKQKKMVSENFEWELIERLRMRCF